VEIAMGGVAIKVSLSKVRAHKMLLSIKGVKVCIKGSMIRGKISLSIAVAGRVLSALWFGPKPSAISANPLA